MVMKSLKEFFNLFISLSVWVGCVITSVILTVSALLLPLFNPTPLSFLLLTFVAVLVLVPVDIPTPYWAKCFISRSIDYAIDYFQLRVIIEDESLFEENKAYILGYEPHSTLPIGVPIVFNPNSRLLPSFFKPIYGFASSAWSDIWWALGFRPATKETIYRYLDSKATVLINPGGIREVQALETGKEVIFLKQRLGFVRIAIHKGVPLVSVFAFGQTDAYSFKKISSPPFPRWFVAFFDSFSRMIGFHMLFVWGRFGTILPYQTQMTMVVGKPIEVMEKGEDESEEEHVKRHLNLFIENMRGLYEKYKQEAGYQKTELIVL